jgi:Delta3,5-Delta2,4-dienoyl-CoA isomerase
MTHDTTAKSQTELLHTFVIMSPSSGRWWGAGAARHQPHPRDNEFRYLKITFLVVDDDPNLEDGTGEQPSPLPPHTSRVVCVGLDRPNRRNALNRDMWVELGQFFAELDPSTCRAVLLYGLGDAFCAGIDVTDDQFLPASGSTTGAVGAADPARIGLSFLPKLRQMQDCFSALERCPVPVVAAVHGPCVGAGVDLVCAADVVWCTQASYFSVREVSVGLAADVGTLQRLPKRTGNHSLVREVCLSGRNFDADEALTMGLVGRVFPTRKDLMQDAIQLCTLIASHSPVAVAGTKRALLHARDHSVEDGLDDVALFNALALQSPDTRIAMKAAAAKRGKIASSKTFPGLLPRSKL